MSNSETDVFVQETRFLAHETKVRYNGINGMIEVALEFLKESVPPDNPAFECLKKAKEIGKEGAAQLNSLLVLGRLKDGRQILSKKKENLARLIKYSIEMVTAQEKCRAKFNPLFPLGERAYWANIDITLMGVALENMLRNADEKVATLPEEQREVLVFILPNNEQNLVTISVMNHGDMPDEVRADFFKKNVSTKYEGTGLGSQIIDMIAKAHKGSAALTCRNNKVTVSMTFPMS